MADIYEMKMAVIVADERRDEMIFQFKPLKNDPEINISIPAGAVGNLVAQLAAAHQSLAMKSTDKIGALLPLKLTGARPFDSSEGPTLLLQFENVFELAVLVSSSSVQHLAAVAQRALEPRSGEPPKTH